MSRTTRRAVLSGTLALAAVAANSRHESAPPDLVTLARVLRDRCKVAAEQDDLSGAILLAHRGKTLYRAAFGLRNRGEQLPNNVDTKFNLASIGKMFTALAVLRLAQARRWGLGDRLLTHWPDYPRQAGIEDITLEQLLAHTSGIPNYWDELATIHPASLVTLADTHALIAKKPLEHAPGSRFSYSNGGYIVLGRLIEKVTGEDYFEYCHRSIFEPLGMRNTDCFRADETVANLAIGYVRDAEKPGIWRSNIGAHVFRGSSAGGGYSTVDDLTTFAWALQQGRLLNDQYMRLWTTGRHEEGDSLFALGCMESLVNGHRMIGHSGGHAGIAGELMIFTDPEISVALLTNGEVDSYRVIEKFIKQQLLGDTPLTLDYWFTRDVVRGFESNGIESARRRYSAKRPGRNLRESVLDTYAQRALHRKQTAAGLGMLRLNAEVFPSSPSAWWALAEALRIARSRADAIAAYQRFLELQPGDKDAERRIAELSQ